MKKLGVIVVSIAFLAGTAAAGWTAETKSAPAKTGIVRGKVVTVDAASHQITVREKGTTTEKTILVSDKELAGLKVGENVRVVLKKGTNAAEKVHVIQEGHSKGKSAK